MKKIFLVLFIFAGLTACNQNKNTTPETEPLNPSEESTDRMFSRDDVEREQDAVDTENDSKRQYHNPADRDIEGTYQLVDAESDSCECNCVEVSFSEETELCVVPDEISIRVRFERTGESMANVFFVEPVNSGQNAQASQDLQGVDRNTPIARLDLQPNNTFVLEWQGLSRNGQIMADHPRLGKKTLEGTYVKRE